MRSNTGIRLSIDEIRQIVAKADSTAKERSLGPWLSEDKDFAVQVLRGLPNCTVTHKGTQYEITQRDEERVTYCKVRALVPCGELSLDKLRMTAKGEEY